MFTLFMHTDGIVGGIRLYLWKKKKKKSVLPVFTVNLMQHDYSLTVSNSSQ